MRTILMTSLTIGLLGVAGCDGQRKHGHAGHADHGAKAAGCCADCPTEAIAVVQATQGNKTGGAIRFSQQGTKVRITGEVTGLNPNQKHAFHIHEFGDASAPDAASAGGHYNPGGHQHGDIAAAERHAGDLGNLQADATGKARVDLTVEGLTVCGATSPVLGRSVIIHKNADDFTQPVGNAGPRIGIGIIGVAKPAAPAAPAK